jgi:hypothetical protein
LNILDENIVASQCAQLQKWGIRFSHIGTDFGRQGMKDLTEIVPLLHRLRRPTFFTHDLGFFDPLLSHRVIPLFAWASTPKRPLCLYAASCVIRDSAHRNNVLERSF